MDTTVAQPEETAPTEEAPVETAEPKKDDDPFSLDESNFVSLTPEQRAALDPVLHKWKEGAKSYAQKEREAERKNFEGHVKKAEALEKLVQDPRFQKWYHETNQAPQNPNKTPDQVATPEEWAQALQMAAQGDPTQWQTLNQKMLAAFAGPTVQKLQADNALIMEQSEMNSLIAKHPDIRDLDLIGRETDPTSPSLFELCLAVVRDKRGGTMEQAYQMAKNVASAMETKGKRAAMGLVTDKKGAITENKPKNDSKDEGIIYLDTMEEAMSANIEAAMDGRKVKYAVKKK